MESQRSSILDLITRDQNKENNEIPTRLERVERQLLGIASNHYTDFEDPFNQVYGGPTTKEEKPYFSVRDNSQHNTSMQESQRSLKLSKSKAEILYD